MKRKLKIHYWPDEIYVELPGRWEPCITISNGHFSFGADDIDYGDTGFEERILLYDLCALLELWREYIEGV